MKNNIIWTSSLDLSEEGIAAFCKAAAPRCGKTEEYLRKLSIMDLAIRYMLPERRKKRLAVMEKLSVPCETPILVISDKAVFGNQSYMDCEVLAGEKLSEIFSVSETGLSVTFYSDGKDIRCESLTENGADHFLFRFVTGLSGLQDLADAVRRGQTALEEELSACTASILPKVSALLGWTPLPQKTTSPSLSAQISRADKKKASFGRVNHKEEKPEYTR